MDLIKLLDVASPKKTKDTINLLIEDVGTAKQLAESVSSNAAAAKLISEEAKQVAEEAKLLAETNVGVNIDSADWISIDGDTTQKAKELYFGLDFNVTFPDDNGKSIISLSDFFDYNLNTKLDNKIAALVNSAPETLDTLGEIATAIQENETVVDALNAAIGNKQDKLIAGENITIDENNVISATGGGGELNITDLPKFTNKLYINMANITSLAGVCTFTIVESSNFIVDWGDGTTTDYAEAVTEISHTYSDTNFAGWVYIYGDWKGIAYDASSGTARQAIEKIIFDNNITTIVNKAFRDARNLNYVYLPDSITLIEKQGFYGCSKLKQLKLPTNVSIGQYGLASIGVTEIVFPQNADTDDLVFSHTPLKIFHIEEGRTKFPSDIHIFRGCFDLKELTLPSTLTSFDGGVMSTSNECLITKLTVKGSNTTMSRQFLTPHRVNTILVPYANLQTYKAKTNWVTYADFIYPKGGNYSETITIPVSSWDTSTNTVTVEAVGATSEDRNVITWSVSSGGVQVENTYGLKCTAQGTMSLTFSCETIPTEDVEVSVQYVLTNY